MPRFRFLLLGTTFLARNTDAGGGGGGGDVGFDWGAAGLDAEHAEWVKAKGYGGPTEVVKAARSLEQTWLGSDKAALPKADANGVRDYTKWGGWREHFGVPEKPDGYALPKETKFTPESLSWWQQAAHRHNIPPQAFAGLLADYGTFVEGHLTAQGAEDQAKWDTNEAATRALWGAAHDEKMQRLAAVLPEPMAAALGIGKIYGLPAEAMDWLDKAAAAMDPDRDPIGAGGGGAGAGTMTPAEAGASIQAVMMDPKHAYHDDRHPDHAKAVAEMQRLFTLKSGQRA